MTVEPAVASSDLRDRRRGAKYAAERSSAAGSGGGACRAAATPWSSAARVPLRPVMSESLDGSRARGGSPGLQRRFRSSRGGSGRSPEQVAGGAPDGRSAWPLHLRRRSTAPPACLRAVVFGVTDAPFRSQREVVLLVPRRHPRPSGRPRRSETARRSGSGDTSVHFRYPAAGKLVELQVRPLRSLADLPDHTDRSTGAWQIRYRFRRSCGMLRSASGPDCQRRRVSVRERAAHAPSTCCTRGPVYMRHGDSSRK